MEKQIDDKKLKEIFTESKVIALVGASAKKDKTSHIVMKYLIEFGFEVIPVNPGAAGQEILGQMTYRSIKEIDKQVQNKSKKYPWTFRYCARKKKRSR